MAWPPVLQAIGAIVRRDLQQDGVLRLEEPALPEAERRRSAVTLHKRGPAVAIKLDAQVPRACHRADCGWTFSVNDRFFPLFRQDVQGLCGGTSSSSTCSRESSGIWTPSAIGPDTWQAIHPRAYGLAVWLDETWVPMVRMGGYPW